MRLGKFIKIYVALVLAMTLSACMKEDVADNSLQITLKARVCKSVLATKGDGPIAADYENPLYIGLMRIDSKLYGWPENGFLDSQAKGPYTATMQGDSDVKTITFNEIYQSFPNERDGIRYASWYPWYKKAAEEENGKYKYDRASATVHYSNIDGSTDILYGSIVEGNHVKKFETVEFSHALCKFRIYAYAMEVYGTDGKPVTSTAENWGSIEEITVQGLPDGCTLHLPKTGKDADAKKTTVSYSATLEDYKMTELCQIEPGRPLLEALKDGWDNRARLGEFMVAPPVDGVLKIDIKTSKQAADQIITIARDFRPGHHYDIVLRFSDHGLVNATATVGEWETDPDPIDHVASGEIFYDLGANETANCYIVNSANYNYAFDATVKGNGDTGAYNGQRTSLSPGYVDVIWMEETLKESFVLMSNTLSEGRVLFKVAAREADGTIDKNNHKLQAMGNVLIGAYRDNTKKELLWTWHLWVTDKPKEIAYKNGFISLNMNLGAEISESGKHEKNEYDGLYYQWGRPTPMPFRTSIGYPTYNPDGTLASWKSFENGYEPEIATQESLGVEKAVVNPWSFYENGVYDEIGARHRLWGWKSEHDEYSKTIYDPCPAGYRVSSKKLWTELTEYSHNSGDHFITIETKERKDIHYPILGWFHLNGSKTAVEGRYYWDGTNATKDCGAYIWTSSYDVDSDRSNILGIEIVGGTLREQNPGLMDKRGYALPVRCVIEKSKAHVTDLSSYQTANSYIISSEGYYKFKATVRGNGLGQLVSNDGSSSIDIREGLSTSIKDRIHKVDYLWWQGDLKEGNTFDHINDIELLEGGIPDKDGYVKIHVKEFTKGNLVLAALEETGEILWTWHLWLTDTPKLLKSHDYVIMDRFLGATWAPSQTGHSAALQQVQELTDKGLAASIGLYFQWGRKDPFPGPDIAKTSGGFETSETYSWWKHENGTWVEQNEIIKGDNCTMGNTVADPMTFHKSVREFPHIMSCNLSATEYSEEYNEQNKSIRMDDSQKAGALWGYSGDNGFSVTTSKTMYDPCPPGYSVSYYLLWRSTDRYGYESDWYYSNLDRSWRNFSEDYPEPVAKKGILLDPSRFGKEGGFDTTWYPFGGYIDPYSGEFTGVGYHGLFYSATPLGGGARSFYYNAYGTGNLYHEVGWIGIPTSYGFPVRCQKQ